MGGKAVNPLGEKGYLYFSRTSVAGFSGILFDEAGFFFSCKRHLHLLVG
jgi:hypothetical protein